MNMTEVATITGVAGMKNDARACKIIPLKEINP